MVTESSSQRHRARDSVMYPRGTILRLFIHQFSLNESHERVSLNPANTPFLSLARLPIGPHLECLSLRQLHSGGVECDVNNEGRLQLLAGVLRLQCGRMQQPRGEHIGPEGSAGEAGH